MSGRQERTPLFTGLVEYASTNPQPFHVPGHKKGRGMEAEFRRLLGEEVLSLDLTNIPRSYRCVVGYTYGRNFDYGTNFALGPFLVRAHIQGNSVRGGKSPFPSIFPPRVDWGNQY
ncbi:MAG: hypothetical protein GX956_05795 [Firmicutes bacterium]|nr:hypothetical protein [Bacillota bacterium]